MKQARYDYLSNQGEPARVSTVQGMSGEKGTPGLPGLKGDRGEKGMFKQKKFNRL